MSHCSQEHILAALDRYLTDFPLPDELWIFAYGSLLWNPEMSVVESRKAELNDFNEVLTCYLQCIEVLMMIQD